MNLIVPETDKAMTYRDTFQYNGKQDSDHDNLHFLCHTRIPQ
jgi:hypothetical protein